MISAIVPHYPLSKDHDDMLHRCIKSLKGADEIIIVVNDGKGFGYASNLGVSLASGDFCVIINNDTEMYGDWSLEDLADEECVTHPYVNGVKQEFSGAFLCIPRWVITERGGYIYDEQFKVGFWEDVDFWQWLVEKEIPFVQKECGVTHPHPGSTMRYMDKNIDSINKQKFLAKHGKLPIKNWS